MTIQALGWARITDPLRFIFPVGTLAQTVRDAHMPQMLEQLRILVVEDEYFLANDLARALTSEGADVIGPAATACEAFQLIDKGLDAAVLDIKLTDGQAFAIADELVRMHVPFAFATGYGPDTIPRRFRDVVRIDKPFDAGAVGSVIARLAVSRKPR